MRTLTSFAISVLLCAAVTADAAAQWNVARFGAGRNRLYTTVAVDPAIVTTVGYARVIPVFGREIQLAGDAGVVSARMDARDFRARIEIQSSIVRWRSLQLAGSASFMTRGTDNAIYRGLNFGADLTATGGVYRPRWFAAAQFGKDKAVITHVTHSDWYRDNFYPDAKDGWYLDAGGTYHYGVAGGVAIGRAELVGRFGFQQTEDFNDLTLPMYLTLGVGFGF